MRKSLFKVSVAILFILMILLKRETPVKAESCSFFEETCAVIAQSTQQECSVLYGPCDTENSPTVCTAECHCENDQSSYTNCEL